MEQEAPNCWTDTLEISIKNIGERCGGYRWLHHTMMVSLNKFNSYADNIRDFINIILSLCCFSTGSTGVDPIFIYIFGILNFIASFIQRIKEKWNLSETIEAHKTITAKFNSLFNNVVRTLSVPREDRENAKEYFMWLSNEYSKLIDNAPEIYEKFLDKYKTMVENGHHIAMPEEIMSVEATEITVQKEGFKKINDDTMATKKFGIEDVYNDINMKRMMHRSKTKTSIPTIRSQESDSSGRMTDKLDKSGNSSTTDLEKAQYAPEKSNRIE